MLRTPGYTPAPTPDFEPERLEELRTLGILGTGSEERFDHYTEHAADIFEVPIALVSLTDRDRQWFKAAVGVDVSEVPRRIAFCAHAILEKELLVVEDAAKDPRFADNPMVVREPRIRFYAGAVLRGPTGQPLGTICLIDHRPRTFGERERRRLCHVARMVEKELHYSGYLAQLRRQIEYKAFFDSVTDLPNRQMLQQALKQTLREAESRQECVAVLHLNMDRFGDLVSALGQAAADVALYQIGQRLRNAFEPRCLVGRWRDDRFVVVIPLAGGRTPESAAEAVVALFKYPFEVNDRSCHFTVKVGGSVFPGDGMDADDLLAKAANAQRVKGPESPSHYHFYTEEIDRHLAQRFSVERRLRRASSLNEFHLFYQPKIDLRRDRLCGMEALLRWVIPGQPPVLPGAFIPVAEQSGLIVPIGNWTLMQACRQWQAWDAAGLSPPPVSVNVAPAQLRQGDFVQQVETTLNETGIPPERLELEVTESSFIEDMDRAVNNLRAVGEMGIQVAIDDFGTGYSSFRYLKRLPVHTVKIDRGFISDVSDARGAALVDAMIRVAQTLGLSVVAEGIESLDQLNHLKASGCDQAQGFLLSAPLAVDDMEAFLRRERYVITD